MGCLKPSALEGVPFDLERAVYKELSPVHRELLPSIAPVYILHIDMFPREEGLEYLIPVARRALEKRIELRVIANVYAPGWGWSGWKDLWRGHILAHDGVWVYGRDERKPTEPGSYVVWGQAKATGWPCHYEAVEVVEVPAKRCSACGAAAEPGAKYCWKCGAKLGV